MTHTPGPWEAEDRGNRVHDIRFFWLVPNEVSLGSANPADAILAAAAPDLLEALEAICNASWRDRNSFLNAGRAAIAKARGETA